MPVTEAIAHRLTRTANDKSFQLRDQPLTDTELSTRLLGQIKPLFTRRASKRYGCFADESTVFKGLFKNWLGETLSLAAFSQKSIEYLAIQLEEQDVESDGHWLFAVEQQESGRYLWLAQLQQKAGLRLTDDADLDSTDYIDFAKIGFCACFDLEQHQQPEQRKYLTLSFGFGDRGAQATLLDFIGFTDTVDTSADTERFMTLVRDYASEMPEDAGKRYQKEVAEFCIDMGKAGAAVNYHELAREVESVAETSLDSYIAAQDPELKEEFIPDQSSLKKYIRYTGRSREVSISFSNESLGRSVTFDPATETLTLSDLPATLIKQLKGE